MKINETLKYVLFGGLFGVLLVPFIVANHQFFPFITGKGFVFRIGVEILFAIWLVLAIRDRSYLPRFSWITASVLAFIGIIALADIFGKNPYKSFWSNFERMEGLVSLIHLVLYYIVASSMFRTERIWKAFLNTSVAMSIVMCVYSFFQLGGKIVINQGGVRVDGTFGNATYLAVYMLINIFFAAFLFAKSKGNMGLRITYVIAMLMQGLVLYHTATRGAILGLIGGALVSAVLIALFAKDNKKARLSALAGLAAVLLVVGGFFAIRNTEFAKSSPTLGRFTDLNFESIKTQGRYFVWPMAIEGFKERPILGWGQENFNYVFNKNYDARMYGQEQWFDRTHNIFLDWLIAGGVLGLLSYLSLYAALLFYLWRNKNFSLIEKSVLTGLVSAYLFQNIFVFDNLVSYILFFSMLAFVHAMNTQEKEPVAWISRLTQNREIAERIATPIIVIGVIVSLYFVNIKPIQANRALIKAITPGGTPAQTVKNFEKVFSYNTFARAEATEQFLQALNAFSAPSVPEADRVAFVNLVKKEIKTQIDATPEDTRYLLFFGSFLSQIGEFKEALPYLERAQATSPNKQSIYFAKGAAYIGVGESEYTKALEAFKTAYDLEPNYSEARLIYGIGAIYNRQYDLAEQLFAPIDPLIVVFDDRILSAYFYRERYVKVSEILERRVQERPNDAQLRFQRAAGFFQMGDKARSIAELRKAVEIEPGLKAQADYLIGEIQAGRNPMTQ